MEYVELAAKTNYSFLRGASHPHEIIAEAARLGMRALGIADCDGVYGLPKAYLATRQTPSVKLICGAQFTLESHPDLIVLAENRSAFGLMTQMLTQSHAGQEKGKALLTWKDFADAMQRPASGGLWAIAPPGSRYAELKAMFAERMLIPLSVFLDGQDQKRFAHAREVNATYDARIVAHNDVHYHSAERRLVQDVLASIRENIPLSRMGYRLFSNGERYLKSFAQMAKHFRHFPEALANTVEVAEHFTFQMNELRYTYPSEWIPAGATAQSYLESLVWQGAKCRYPEGTPENVVRQLQHELQLIRDLAFADYFLTIWEIVEYARGRDILCQGRGSAANSAVCFVLGITAIDPVRMNLLFERFISVERGEPPDIDVDFEHERREEVIQHIYEKYGRHRAAMVSAVITYRKRSALRDTCRMLEVPYEKRADDPRVEKVASVLRDFPRHLTIHSGGFTLSAAPMTEIVPIEPARMPGRTIVQWDKYDLDALGLLKVDILALGMLTALKKSMQLAGISALTDLPIDDRKTYAMIHRADTIGVFQIESRAQMNMSQRLLPKNYYDLVIQVAIVRPGPIVGKMVHPYLRRRRGIESPDVPDARLTPILERTLGVPLFQEQVMKMAIVLAGFTPGEADQLRRAIGAWRSSGEIEKWGRKLMHGLLAEGLPQSYVEQIFAQIQGFAEYGFPESHAASFALLTYASAYLKAHYPAEFACALINSQPLGFYAVHTIVDDAKRHEVCVLAVSPLYSHWDCELHADKSLRLGLRVVHGLHRREADDIVAKRQQKTFTDLRDFVSRVRLRKNVLQQLALSDAFACFGLNPRQALWEILGFYNLVVQIQGQRSGQLNLFVHGKANAFTPQFLPMSRREQVAADYETYGLSVREHPMAVLRSERKLPGLTSVSLRSRQHGQFVKTSGLVIVRQRPHTAKGVVFCTLEDESGFIDLMLHKETAEHYRALFEEHAFLIVSGLVQRDGRAVSVLAKKLQPIFASEPEPLEISSHDWH